MSCHLYCGVTQVSVHNTIPEAKSTQQYKSTQHNRWSQRSTGVVFLKTGPQREKFPGGLKIDTGLPNLIRPPQALSGAHAIKLFFVRWV